MYLNETPGLIEQLSSIYHRCFATGESFFSITQPFSGFSQQSLHLVQEE